MKLIGYARVSTRGQADDGLGLSVQAESIEKWATANGHELVATVTDEAVSGTREAWERPGLTALLGTLEARYADGMLIHRLDRLARSLTIQESILAHVWKGGGHVFTCDNGEVRSDESDPMRVALRQMMGCFAELERALLVKRLKDARMHKARLGGHATGGAPFGYRPGGWTFDVHPEEQETLKLIRMLHNEGHNPSEISRRLNDLGHASKRGGHWHPTSVRRTIARMQRDVEKGANGSGE